MLRLGFVSAILLGASLAQAAPADPSQCVRDMAGLNKSFAHALDDLARHSAEPGRCTAWRRQIDTYEKASAVLARCAPEPTRAQALGQMQGSIANFRGLLSEARCPSM